MSEPIFKERLCPQNNKSANIKNLFGYIIFLDHMQITRYNNGIYNGILALKYETNFYSDDRYSTSGLLVIGDTYY